MKQSQATVAIVGYPNVGKSALWNRMVRDARGSLVYDQPRITRDHLIKESKWLGRKFWLIDTGGIQFKPQTNLDVQVQSQVEYAINHADLLLLVFSNHEQIGEREQRLITWLLRFADKLIIVITKSDQAGSENSYYQFNLPAKIPLLFVSAITNRNIDQLFNSIIDKLQIKQADEIATGEETEESDNQIKFALVGKTNAGKSCLSQLITQNRNRFVTSQTENTTRDTLTEPFLALGESFQLVDTPGLRIYHGKKKISDQILYYAYLRSLKAVIDSKLVLLIIDITKPITRQHKKIAAFILSEYKLVIIILNKQDLLVKSAIKERVAHVQKMFVFLPWAKIIPVSAMQKESRPIIIKSMVDIYKRSKVNIPRSVLNQFCLKLSQTMKMPRKGQKTLKIYYLFQKKTEESMIEFVVFINDIALVTPSFSRAIENKFYVGLFELLKYLPIKVIFRSKV